MTDTRYESQFEAFDTKLRRDGSNEWNIRSFRRNYFLLLGGDTGIIPESAIRPVEYLPHLESLSMPNDGTSLLNKVAVVKLNGGLGTGMGLDRAKSIIPVRGSLTFLDIIARQILRIEERTGVRIPLIFMNSYNTREDTYRVLQPYNKLRQELPIDFLQNRVPKVDVATMMPAVCESSPELEWCPPGHGDMYIALRASGILDTLIRRGYEYIFISNADNLGAVLDERILALIDREKIPFLMEVAARTEADSKGGHLALTQSGAPILRERAQCDESELERFQDIRLYSFFNTNNLWIRLPSLLDLMDRYENVLPLPLIRNKKPLDPRDRTSAEVYQLETAMGSALGLFDGSAALAVPRMRFAPVKFTSDLLAVRSDAYTLTEDYQVMLDSRRRGEVPVIDLEPLNYGNLDQLDTAFPFGPPSLIGCARLAIRGRYQFGEGVSIAGSVELTNRTSEIITIEDNTILKNHKDYLY